MRCPVAQKRLTGGSALSARGSHQPQPLQARVAVLANDDVIVHGDPERAGDGDDLLSHLNVGLRRRRSRFNNCIVMIETVAVRDWLDIIVLL